MAGWLLFMLGGMAIALLWLFLVFMAIHRTYRVILLSRAPWSKLGQLRPGLVKVQGQVVATHGTLRSPLRKTECVYFRFRVKKNPGAHAPDVNREEIIIDDTQEVPFALDDGTGKAALQMKAELVMRQPKATVLTTLLSSASPELEATLQSYGQSSTGRFLNLTLECCENWIEEGNRLLVLGTARALPQGSWELIPSIVSDMEFAELLGSYQAAAVFWWCLALLLGGASPCCFLFMSPF